MCALAKRTMLAAIGQCGTRQVLRNVYESNIGIQFRHAQGKDIHAPGFYLHLAREECFLAVGCWHPDADVLGKLRDAIAQKPEQWLAARNDPAFAAQWSLGGDSLTRPPRGYAVDHPAIADLKRKDLIALAPLSLREATGSGLVKLAGKRFAETAPFMKFLCDALAVPL